jgi:tRNA A-37 threonylcarbamoyl transferase component Bud32/tetratricopeptide (TPR) repeat protein
MDATRRDDFELSTSETQSQAPDRVALTRPGAGELIGCYRLVQLIGEGGMGEVWLADQTEVIRRRVALKLIKPGLDTREVIARFHSERQAMALMNHPAIAKVFEVGATPEGRPWCAMEHVPGMPITAYCDKHKLSVRERLELFICVCDGVQHAHQKAIIHRDLKPSNILVTENDGRPEPKIIDFGVAKATSQQLTGDAMFTRVGSVIGTVEYMSPEQAESGPEDIDTRSDIYSMGAVLYEMLVGALPIDYRKMTFSEVLRKLREEDIARPSTRLRTLGAASDPIARNRATEPRTLTRQLRGDLDCIVLKALEKERRRRYGAASELGADIRRYLRNEAIVAAPAGAGYRARKYIRRNRIALGAASAFIILLASFSMVEAVQLRRITRQRDRLERTTKFMAGLFTAPGPSFARGANRTAGDILADGVKQIDKSLKDDPELQADMLEVLGRGYATLGFDARSESLFARTWDIRRRALGPDRRETLRARSLAASSRVIQGREKREAADAEKEIRATLEAQQRTLGQNDLDTLASMEVLGRDLVYQGRLAEAEPILRKTLDARQRVLGRDNPLIWISTQDLFLLTYREHKYSDAEHLAREAVETARTAFGPESGRYGSSLLYLGSVLVAEHKYTDLEGLAHEAVAGSRGNPSITVFATHLLMQQGAYSEAEKIGQDTLDTSGEIMGPQDSRLARTFYNLSCVKARLGKRDQAIALLRQAIKANPPIAASYIEADDDFASVRKDPRFIALIADYRRRESIRARQTHGPGHAGESH